ncbi:hypothetical protein CHS0354_001333 [Potamilus streckersoni]|uniref:Uncharacterized protein n=1 Tax=Potamilus streckersoni TaxID=2493646 RepID=A0AAE0VJR7_9BIVA|nr:hypothetical protein CHS0354_001333 [Potamilus streckersoni]
MKEMPKGSRSRYPPALGVPNPIFCPVAFPTPGDIHKAAESSSNVAFMNQVYDIISYVEASYAKH